MTVQSPPLLLSAAGISTPSRTFRQSFGAQFRPGSAPLAAAGGALYGPAGSMGELTLVTDLLLRINPAVWVVNGTRSTKQGQYLVPNDDLLDLAIAAKDASLSRRALVAVTVNDSQEDGVAASSLNDRAFVQIVLGALAASNPALPPAPANALLLGELLIPSTASGSPVTITRYDPRTVSRGGILPVVADTLTQPGHGAAPGAYSGEYRDHPTAGLQRWDGAAWQPFGLGGDTGWVPLTVTGGMAKNASSPVDFSYRVRNSYTQIHAALTGNAASGATIGTVPAVARPARDWYGVTVAFGNVPIVTAISSVTGNIVIQQAVTTGGMLWDVGYLNG